jgi:hypothetical protein
MRSTVVKRDTASRERNGSSRAEINAETIMWRSTVENKDKMEPIMSHSTVVKRDTASRERHGSSRAEINLEMNMKHSTLVEDDASMLYIGNDIKRGCQHVFKSNSTSSRRVQEAYNNCLKNGTPRSKLAVRRDKAKRKKIERLTVILPSPVHSLSKAMLLSSRPIFYSGTVDNTGLCGNRIPNSVTLSVMEHLQVVDTRAGARLNSSGGDNVFTLIPREYAIAKMCHVKETLMALYALENTKSRAEVRGKKRIPVPEDDGKYTTVGLKPNRGSSGISDSWPKRLHESDRRKICKLMSQCEEVAKGYLSSNEMRGLRIAQLLGGWPEIEGGASQPIWGSLACGRNYYLNSHLDDDFFYSLCTIASPCGLRQDIDRYSMDAEVCNYFTFPEQGIAVALRPGDMFLFNPRYYHSLSSRTSSFQRDDVFCLSLYLKTAIVGKNNNALR